MKGFGVVWLGRVMGWMLGWVVGSFGFFFEFFIFYFRYGPEPIVTDLLSHG